MHLPHPSNDAQCDPRSNPSHRFQRDLITNHICPHHPPNTTESQFSQCIPSTHPHLSQRRPGHHPRPTRGPRSRSGTTTRRGERPLVPEIHNHHNQTLPSNNDSQNRKWHTRKAQPPRHHRTSIHVPMRPPNPSPRSGSSLDGRGGRYAQITTEDVGVSLIYRGTDVVEFSDKCVFEPVDE